VVVLARVEHGAVLILAIGEVDEVIGENPNGGAERAGEGGGGGHERRERVHVHREAEETTRALGEGVVDNPDDAVLVGLDVVLGDDVEAAAAARAIAIDLR